MRIYDIISKKSDTLGGDTRRTKGAENIHQWKMCGWSIPYL